MSDVDGVDVAYGRQAYERQAYERQAYPRVRKTLRNRRYQQSGGDPKKASQASPPLSFPTFTSIRKKAWQAASSGIYSDNNLNFLVAGEGSDTTLTLEQYITIIENQDNLFKYALEAMYKMLEMSKEDEADEVKIIEAFKKKQVNGKLDVFADKLNFVKDVFSLISFQVPEGSYFKFNILKNEGFNQLQLFVNPQMLTNLFIHDLARICIAQKKDTILLTRLGDNDKLISLQAARYNAIVDANSLALTSMASNGGFYITQSKAGFNFIRFGSTNETLRDPIFFKIFIKYCKSTLPDNFSFKREQSNLIATVFAALASIIFHSIEVTSFTVKLSDIEEKIIAMFPPLSKTLTKYEDIFNKQKLFERISLEEYQFVIHLCAVINKLATEDTKPA